MIYPASNQILYDYPRVRAQGSLQAYVRRHSLATAGVVRGAQQLGPVGVLRNLVSHRHPNGGRTVRGGPLQRTQSASCHRYGRHRLAFHPGFSHSRLEGELNPALSPKSELRCETNRVKIIRAPSSEKFSQGVKYRSIIQGIGDSAGRNVSSLIALRRTPGNTASTKISVPPARSEPNIICNAPINGGQLS